MKTYREIPSGQQVVEVLNTGKQTYSIARTRGGMYVMYRWLDDGFEKVSSGDNPAGLEETALMAGDE